MGPRARHMRCNGAWPEFVGIRWKYGELGRNVGRVGGADGPGSTPAHTLAFLIPQQCRHSTDATQLASAPTRTLPSAGVHALCSSVLIIVVIDIVLVYSHHAQQHPPSRDPNAPQLEGLPTPSPAPRVPPQATPLRSPASDASRRHIGHGPHANHCG